MGRFERHRTRDDDLERIQDNLDGALNPLLANPLLDGGVLLSSKAIATSATNVAHSLGRVPRGWIVVDRDADARVWRSAAASTTFLPLRASAAVNVVLYVF